MHILLNSNTLQYTCPMYIVLHTLMYKNGYRRSGSFNKIHVPINHWWTAVTILNYYLFMWCRFQEPRNNCLYNNQTVICIHGKPVAIATFLKWPIWLYLDKQQPIPLLIPIRRSKTVKLGEIFPLKLPSEIEYHDWQPIVHTSLDRDIICQIPRQLVDEIFWYRRHQLIRNATM